MAAAGMLVGPAPSIAHRIPLLFPFAEMEGVEPGQLKVFTDWATGEVDNNPLDNRKAFALSASPMKYTRLFQNAGVAYMAAFPPVGEGGPTAPGSSWTT